MAELGGNACRCLIGCAVAVALLFFAAEASATAVTAPAGTTYTGTIKAENSGGLTLHGVVDLTCNKAALEGKLESHGAGVTAKGTLSSFTLSECGHHVVTNKAGVLEFHATSNGNATVTWSLAEITVEFTTIFGNVHCVFGTSTTHVGTLTAAPSDSDHAVLDIEGAAIPVKSGSGLCGSSAEWTGKFKFTSPTGLRVDDGDSAKGVTAPAGTAYTGTIKAENSGGLTLHGVVDLTCNKAALEGKLESHGAGVTARGTLSSFTLSECGQHVVVLATGRMELHATSSGNATLTWSLAEITVEFTTIFGNVHCVFGTSNTHVGTLTAAPSDSGHAVLDIEGAAIPVKEGPVMCGSSAEWTGKFKFTSPTGLRVD